MRCSRSNGQTRVPGIAKVSVNPLKDSEYCVQLMDDQGNSLTDPECQKFDGSHNANLLTQYFPNQGAFNGSVEVCFNGEPSSSSRDQISVLPIEVIQENGIIQLGTNKGTLTNPGRCVQDGKTLCLNDDRFKVEVDSGMVADINPDDSGLFYFVDPDNWELLVKVLDGCGGNNNYWVFFAATTNVEFTVTVTDTQTSQKRTYPNPGAFVAITDTSAFATCP